MALISDGRFVEDGWRRLADEEALPKSGKFIVSLARLDQALEKLTPDATLGVLAPNTSEVDALAAALPKLGLISIAFPAFADGRGFSLARLLRCARDAAAGQGFDSMSPGPAGLLLDLRQCPTRHRRRQAF